MNRTSALLMALVVVAEPAFAAEPTAKDNIQTSVIGTGQFSCGQYIEYEKQSNPAQIDLIVQWVWGFLVAYNYRGFL